VRVQGAGLCKSKDKMAWCLVLCGCQTNQARAGSILQPKAWCWVLWWVWCWFILQPSAKLS